MISTKKYHFALLLALASCTPGKKQPDPVVMQANPNRTQITFTPEQRKSAAIEVGKVVMREVSGSIKVNGVLDVPPQNLVSVSSPLTGFVKNTDLLEGMTVKKDQVLAVLEGQEFIQLQEDYLSDKSQLEFLRLEYERQQELSKENVNSGKTLQLVRSNYLSMKAKTEGLEAKLKLIGFSPSSLESGSIQSSIAVRSPIAGSITQVNINIGRHVTPTDVMFRIVDTEHLHAEAKVFERDVMKLKIGQKVRVLLNNDSRERLANVYLIGKEVTSDRTVRVHCHFQDEDASLIPGMYFNAIIEIGNHPVPALPDEAIVTFEGKKYVFANSGGNEFVLKGLQTGSSDSGYTEVMMSDSLASANIVVHGAYELLSRLKNSEE